MKLTEQILNGRYDLILDDNQRMEKSAASGIYAILNKETGLIYIGQSLNFRKRKTAHLYGLRNKKHRNSWLQKDFNSVGETGFLFIVLEIVEQGSLADREQHYFDLFEYKYNVILFADRRLFTPDHRRNLSIAHKGHRHTDEAKLKIGAASKGNSYRKGATLSEEHKRIVVAALKNAPKRRGKDNPLFGKKRPAELVARMAKQRKANMGGSLAANYKPIAQYFVDGRLIKNWESIKHAHLHLSLQANKISEVCNGKRRTTGGFVFRFLNESTK